MKLGYHFTNSKANWGGKSPYRSTGFVESITRNGARQFLNIGVGQPSRVREAFQHHGTRCNKKRVHGVNSIPAVIIFDVDGLAMQQGYDGPLHRQVNESIPTERILGWFEFDPNISAEDFEEQILSIIDTRELK